jgi:hypothetical protein
MRITQLVIQLVPYLQLERIWLILQVLMQQRTASPISNLSATPHTTFQPACLVTTVAEGLEYL